MNAAQRRLAAEKEFEKNKNKILLPKPTEKQLVTIGRKLYHEFFTDEYIEGEYRMTGLELVTVSGLGLRHHAVRYKVSLQYCKLHKRDGKAWLGWKRIMNEKKPKRFTPEIVVVQRDDIQKSVVEITQAMQTFFHADVLLLKNYTFEKISRQEMKETFYLNGLRLFFTDEL